MIVKSLSTFNGIKDKGYLLTTFIIDELIAIDSGSLGIGIDLESQKKIKYILITHVHMDHIATLPIFLDNIIFKNLNIKIFSSKKNINYLKQFIFNDTIWPDLERIGEEIKRDKSYLIDFNEINPGKTFFLENYEIFPFKTTHIVPTNGIKIINTKKSKGVIFSSDTYSLNNLIGEINSDKRIKTAFIELSFPDSLKSIATRSKHLYPEKLFKSIENLEREIDIFLVHYKKSLYNEIKEDLKKYDFKVKPKFLYPGEEVKID